MISAVLTSGGATRKGMAAGAGRSAAACVDFWGSFIAVPPHAWYKER